MNLLTTVSNGLLQIVLTKEELLMDEFINNPLNLTMETSLQYAILIFIGVIAFLIAWITVGKMYDHRIISGKAAGTLAHWTIRIAAFFLICIVFRSAVIAFQFVMSNWQAILIICGCFFGTASICCIVVSILRKNKEAK